jgi:Leucine-rich repeat (LRR) protein
MCGVVLLGCFSMLAIAFLLSLGPLVANGATPTLQIQALEFLYNSTNGKNWKWKNELVYGAKWSFAFPQSDPCNDNTKAWQGITCSLSPNICRLQTCEIQALRLNDYNLDGTLPNELFVHLTSLGVLLITSSTSLVGSIPSSIGSLTDLSDLTLAANHLSGSLPSQLSELSELISLSLFGNQLFGSISFDLQNFSLLESVSLYDNHLTGTIPLGFFKLSRLLLLMLDTNLLHGIIPSEVGKLSRLMTLSLYGNSLTGTFPTEIGSLTLLTALYCQNNLLTGTIPSSVGDLSLMTMLYLSSNILTRAIPSELSQLTRMSRLYLNNNALTGTIPSSFPNLTRLGRLHLEDNQLSGSIPSSFQRLSQLAALQLESNRLTGVIPSELGDLTNLNTMDLSVNRLSGMIPEELGKLSQLVQLLLFGNRLIGVIPSALAELTSMVIFQLSSNLLTGTIPSGLARLSNLNQLNLYNNRLSGSIPSEMSSMLLLSGLSLHDNHLTGTIPPIPSLVSLHLATNSFTGTISPHFGTLSNLVTFTIDDNLLTGSIPSELGGCASLEEAQFTRNFLTGSLPSSLTNLTRLGVLYLQENQFSGDVTCQLASLPSLQQLFLQSNHFTGHLKDLFALNHSANTTNNLINLDVSGNLFSGMIPSDLFLFPRIKSISLSVNCLERQFPSSICEATSLNVLSMDGLESADGCPNVATVPFTSVSLVPKSSDSIPTCLWSFSELKMLNLAGNGWRGTIGSHSSMTSLLSLTLSHNYLSGTIPLWLQQKNMSLLDLSHNKLTGDVTGFVSQPNYLDLDLFNFSYNFDQTLDLAVNRLSGDLSPSFERYSSLDILSGNLFSCAHTPARDRNRAYSTCGSEQYDQTMSVMGGVIGAILLGVLFYGLCLFVSFSTKASRFVVWFKTRLADAHTLLRDLRYHLVINSPPSSQTLALALSAPQPLEATIAFGHLLANLMKSVLGLTAVSLLLSLPIYLLKQSSVLSAEQHNGEAEFITHSHMYRWLWTIAFVSGEIPAILIFVMALLCLLCFTFFITRLGVGLPNPSDCLQEKINTSSSPLFEDKTKPSEGPPFVMTVGLVFFLNIALVGTINGLYLWSTLLHLSSQVRIWIQFGVGLFSVAWSVLVRRGLSVNLIESSYGLWLLTCLNIVNSVLIPCLVTSLSSPSCYQVNFPPSFISISLPDPPYRDS